MSAKELDFILMQISLSSKTNVRGVRLPPLHSVYLLLSCSRTNRSQLQLSVLRAKQNLWCQPHTGVHHRTSWVGWSLWVPSTICDSVILNLRWNIFLKANPIEMFMNHILSCSRVKELPCHFLRIAVLAQVSAHKKYNSRRWIWANFRMFSPDF